MVLLVTILGGGALTAWRRTRWIGMVLGLGAVAFAVGVHWRDTQVFKGMAGITPRASESEVLSALGQPDRITDGTEWVEAGIPRSPGEYIPGCVREYWYHAFFFPYAQSLCFDANQRLIRITTYSSW
jgi:hypothetical protein